MQFSNRRIVERWNGDGVGGVVESSKGGVVESMSGGVGGVVESSASRIVESSNGIFGEVFKSNVQFSIKKQDEETS